MHLPRGWWQRWRASHCTKAITAIQLEHLRRRLAQAGLGLEVTDAALELLANASFDPVYGARPLKRAIQNELENPLAQKILSGDIEPGEIVVVDAEGGRFKFGGKAAEAA